MPLLILFLILPLADVGLAVAWFLDSPLWAGLYLAAAMIVGMLLMRLAKIGVGEMVRLLQQGGGRPTTLVGFAGMWAAGALLFFPGYLSDGLAAVILLLSLRPGKDDDNVSFEFRSAQDKPPIEAEAEVLDERRD